ncbi:MAG: hypothetical protein HQM10_20040 [Candidatus Riflebacteria bacterium]|nr:hypothetical protein [Candidatus Riflebacteria bacterium]
MKTRSVIQLLCVLALFAFVTCSSFAEIAQVNFFVKVNGTFVSGAVVDIDDANTSDPYGISGTSYWVTGSDGKAGPCSIDNQCEFKLNVKYGNKLFETKRIVGANNTNMHGVVEFRTGQKTLFTFTKMDTSAPLPGALGGTCLVTISYNPMPANNCRYELKDASGASYGDGTFVVSYQNGKWIGTESLDVPRNKTYNLNVYNGSIISAQKLGVYIGSSITRKSIVLKARENVLTSGGGM